MHLRTHSSDIFFPCPEPECTYKAKSLCNMKHHAVTHSVRRDFPCPDCEYAAKLKSQLKLHEFTHKPYAARPLPCMVAECKYRTITLQNLRRHVAKGVCPDRTEK